MEHNSAAPPNSPVPLPRGIRTNKTTPRLIAFFISSVWALVLITGLKSLAHKEKQELAFFDRFLYAGTRKWEFFHDGPGKNSLGCVEIILGQKPGLSLDARGSFLLTAAETHVPTAFNLHATFSELGELDRLTALVESGAVSLSLERPKISAGALRASLSRPGAPLHEMVLKHPEPILLLRSARERYSLRLPTSQGDLMTRLSVVAENTLRKARIAFRECDENGFASCRRELDRGTSEERDALSQLDNLIGLFRRALGDSDSEL